MQTRMSNRAMSAAYWTTTILTALAFLTAGAAYLARGDVQAQGIAVLGYPAYVLTILGTWKVRGGLAILAPRLPLLKEWAYAGFFFDLTGAAASRAFVGDGPVDIAAPLAFLALVVASWALRPASRKLDAAKGEPATARMSAHEIRAA